MKYCPYCGAELLGGTVSFCTECGKAIKERKSKKKSEKKMLEERKKEADASRDIVTDKDGIEEKKTEIVDDGYDGYYDDVLPIDESVEYQGIDKQTVKKIIIIIVGVIVAISICVVAMCLM